MPVLPGGCVSPPSSFNFNETFRRQIFRNEQYVKSFEQFLFDCVNMEKQTTSVSKGCFVFKNGPKRTAKKRKSSVLDVIDSETWYPAFKSTRRFITSEIEAIQSSTYNKVKNNLIHFVENSVTKIGDNLPTAVLLTGINQGDHYQFFDTFTNEIREKLNAPIAVIQARNCGKLKSAIEIMVFGLIENYRSENDEAEMGCNTMRRSQYNIQVLKSWYNEMFGSNGPLLTLVVPDFELFPNDVLLEFMQLLLTIANTLPIVLILGIATDKTTLHRTLPYFIINKLNLCVFQSNPSRQCLNKILNDVVLSPKICINISGNVLNLLTDIFLFFDFSINSFLQGYQYCVMEHYHQGNAFSLCNTKFDDSFSMIKKLKHDDIEQIRQLPSFKPYVESLNDPRQIINLLKDDNYFLKQMGTLLKDIYQYFSKFHCFLRLLMAMIQHLPKNIMGKQLKDLYPRCVSSNIFSTTQFNDTWQLLSLLSKEEFVQTMDEVVSTLEQYKESFCQDDIIGFDTSNVIDEVVQNVKDMTLKIKFANLNSTEDKKNAAPIKLSKFYKTELKNKMMEQTAKSKPTTEFRQQVETTLNYIKTELSKYLVPFSKAPPLHELFVFSDVKTVRQHIMGSPRAALHTALQNPQFYLQCDCCVLEDPTQMIDTLPDLSVVFKLHLESGQMINLFDWLQAFNIVVQDDDSDESEQIRPDIQARFTRAVAELQYLGYIKSSKRKIDHVARLTW